MKTALNNTLLHTGNLLRVDLTCSHHIHKTLHLCEVMDMLISLIAVVISQCICISRHHFVLINVQILLVNYSSIKLEIFLIKKTKLGIYR